MSTEQTPKSIYRRGADDGFIFGVYLSVLFLLQALALVHGWDAASIIGLIMMMAVPVVVYFFLRRGYFAEERRSRFSAMWLHGICIFFFGSLLMALTSYIYMRLVHPGYIPEVVEILRQAYTSIGSKDAMEAAHMVEKIQQQHLYPTAAEIAVTFIWLDVFTGSLLSMLLSLIIRAVYPASRRTPPPMPGQ